MQKIIKHCLYLFMWITGITALVTIMGICIAIFAKQKIPYLEYLIGMVLIEIVSVIVFLARKGLKYLPETENNKTKGDTNYFMKKFITSGSSAVIVSNRLSWLSGNSEFINLLNEKSESGVKIEIITSQNVDKGIKSQLPRVSFITTGENLPPMARFTLINSNRGGAERLAIARGVHPNHEITIFDNNSGPQIIALAKDIIKKSKELNKYAS